MGRPTNEEVAARQAAEAKAKAEEEARLIAEEEAKAKADEIAKQIEITMGTAQIPETNAGVVIEEPHEDTKPVEALPETCYQVYDHMVKVNGIFYNAGEQVPV